MKISSKTIRKYPFSWLCIILIWILCFCTPPHTPLDKVALMDKWTHIVMYAGTCFVIWAEYLRNHRTTDGSVFFINRKSLFIWSWLYPILMSGLIEILQAYCTGGRRSGDWLDFLANSIGATVGAGIGMALMAAIKKKQKK